MIFLCAAYNPLWNYFAQDMCVHFVFVFVHSLAALLLSFVADGSATSHPTSAWPFVDEEGTVTDALQGGGGASEWLPNPSTKRPPGGGAANSGGFGGQRSGGHAPGRAPPPNAATLSSSQRRATAAENAAHSGGSGLWNWAGGDGNKGGGGGEGLRGSVFESAPLREQLRRVAKVFDEYCNHKQRVSRFELVDMLGKEFSRSESKDIAL